mmetsp:Transcript_63602/g.165171  ORF Transcript_63602/g.165171 Transcript_63602/m.165171 type:complete len:201 (-) Transcript_63602:3248-3850(-)
MQNSTSALATCHRAMAMLRVFDKSFTNSACCTCSSFPNSNKRSRGPCDQSHQRASRCRLRLLPPPLHPTWPNRTRRDGAARDQSIVRRRSQRMRLCVRSTRGMKVVSAVGKRSSRQWPVVVPPRPPRVPILTRKRQPVGSRRQASEAAVVQEGGGQARVHKSSHHPSDGPRPRGGTRRVKCRTLWPCHWAPLSSAKGSAA